MKGQILYDSTWYSVPIIKRIETRSRIVVTRSWGEEARGLSCNEYRVSVWDDRKVLKTDRSDSCTTKWISSSLLSCTLKWLKRKVLHFVYFTIFKEKKTETFTMPLLYARNYTADQYRSLSSGTFKIFRGRRQVNSKVQ